MNEQQALRDFCDKALPLCLADTFDRDAFKTLRREFYSDERRKRYRLSNPTLKEVAETLVAVLKRRGTPLAEIAATVSTKPFFRQIADNDRDRLLADLKRESDTYSEETLRKIAAGRSFEAVEVHKGTEIAQKAEETLADLQKRIDEKQAEYESLPSVLDEPDAINEPDFDPDADLQQAWWERFSLRANPFPGKDGLTLVDKELYEEVVVKTKPFKDILARLSRDGTCLFNTAFLLAGGFGFGKTTFLDYLSYVLIERDIVTLRISTTRQPPTSGAYIEAFQLRLKAALQKELDQLGMDIGTDFDADIDSFITEACLAVTARKKGILIVLDDYHKHRTQQAALFEFLGCLQITKDELTRNGIPVGFVVSGLPEWTDEIRRHPTLSGFLDSPVVVLPPITPASIADVFNKRIAAYSYDPTPRTLKLDFIQRVFHTLGDSHGYRDYLNRIITELEDNNLAIVDTPVDISEAELNAIRHEFEGRDALKSSLNKLLKESHFKRFTAQQISRCLELLVQLYVNNGVFERDTLFQTNTHYFLRLRDNQLIQKRKEQHKTYGNTFAWTVHSRLLDAIKAVKERFKREPQEYFLKIFAGDVFKRRQAQSVTRSAPETANPLTECMAFQLPDAARAHLQQATQLYESVLTDSAQSDHPAVLQRLEKSVSALLNAFFILDNSATLFARFGELTDEEKVALHWLGEDEAILEAYRRITQYRQDPSRYGYEQAKKNGLDMFQLLASHFTDLCKDVCDTKRPLPFRLHGKEHTNEELKLFEQVQGDYYSPEREKHFRYVEGMTDLIERRLRDFLYTTTQCLFGEESYFSHAPQGVLRYATRNAQKPTHASICNLYDQLTRPQYREILQSGGVLKKHVADQMIGWTADDWKLFGDQFVENTINTSHQLVKAFTPEQREKYERYCRLGRQFLAAMNKFVGDILLSKAFLISADSTGALPPVSEAVVRFCYVQGRFQPPTADTLIPRLRRPDDDVFKDREILHDHKVSRTSYEAVMTQIEHQLQGQGYCIVDAMELELLRNFYNVPIADFWSSLAYAVHGEQSLELIPWFGSKIMLRAKRPFGKR